MIDAAELIDNDFLRQFEIKIDNHLAKIEYSLQERKIFLTKLIIPEEINAEDFSKEFLSAVFEQIEERNLSVVPTSPEIAKFVRSNRKYKRMLPVGLRIWFFRLRFTKNTESEVYNFGFFFVFAFIALCKPMLYLL